jgi:D-alanyl-D-alanine-carboxypeptidase/D-alanyl-D-alanine-endopeptidase
MLPGGAKMTKNNKPFLVILIFSLMVLSQCDPEQAGDPGFNSLEEEINYLVDRYVRMGAAIGIIDRQQLEHEYYFGRLSNQDDSPPDRHTLFEIGSITKTFTGLLLARLVMDNRIGLNVAAQSYLPGNQVNMPTWNGTVVSMRHLATHSSGLPRVPQDSDYPLPAGYDPADPYALYTTEHIYEYLSDYCELLFEPETGLNYSNTGAGLVGHILGRREGSCFREALKRRILDPLNLVTTYTDLDTQQLNQLAPGHDSSLQRVDIYHFNDIFQGAGAIKSNLNDMMIYLKANLGLVSTPLREAIDFSHQVLFDVGPVTYDDRVGTYHLSIGFFWHIDRLPEGYTFIYHGGRTNGYMAYIGFDKSNRTGAVILCNQSTMNVMIRFGEDLLKAVNKY